jgi:hypothetical protein
MSTNIFIHSKLSKRNNINVKKNFNITNLKLLLNTILWNELNDIVNENIYKTPFINDDQDLFIKRYLIINHYIKKILKKYNDYNLNNFIMNTHSCIFIFEKIVIKIFNYNRVLKNNSNKLYNLIIKDKPECLEEIYELITLNKINTYLMVSKKYNNNYLSILKKNVNLIYSNIFTAILFLNKNKWWHHDLNLTNICFDDNNKKFVLIDFDRSIEVTKKEPNNDDYLKLQKEINYYLTII